jgi:hypothetical protein
MTREDEKLSHATAQRRDVATLRRRVKNFFTGADAEVFSRRQS